MIALLRSMSLRGKAGALLVFAAGVPPLVVAALLLSQERAVRRSLNEDILRARVDQVGDTLQALAQGYAGVSMRYAGDPDFVAFCGSDGPARARLRPVVQAHLAGVQSSDPAIREILILDTAGVVVASSGLLSDRDLSYREYFQRTLRGDTAPDVFIGIPAVDRTPLIAFPFPIRREDRLIGVFAIFVRAETFWAVMRAANGKAGAGSFYILFDRDGVRIGHSANQDLLFRPGAPLSPERRKAMIASERFQERTAELLASVVPFPSEALRHEHAEVTTFRRLSPTNHAWNVGVARYFPSLQWTLVAMIPEREVEVHAMDVIPQALPPTVIGLVLALLGGTLLIRQIVNPIRSLAAAAAALERGDSVGPVPETSDAGGDEVGALSVAFHSMAASLTARDRELWAGYRNLRQVLESVGEGLLAAEPGGGVTGVHSTVTETWFGPVRVAQPVWTYFGATDAAFAAALQERWGALADGSPLEDALARLPGEVHGRARTFQVAYRSVLAGARLDRVILVITDVTEALARNLAERQLEAELRQAQKLEAVGQIAAGIAHEINTPIQYIGDGTRFAKDAFASVAAVLRLHQETASALSAEARERLSTAEEAADLAYILAEVPKAQAQVLEGVQRVSTLVRAMKEFAHPDQKEMVPTDLNRALTATLEISRNEYKYVADLETDLGSIPMVSCHAGDLNQVFLNVIVNAAHAIGDVVKGTPGRGKIRISTRSEGGDVVVSIADTGGGIPWEIRDKVFEPFFTTKPTGKGTGQGLAIARSVVKNHGGHLTFESEVGAGTTFFIRLPVRCAGALDPGAAAEVRGTAAR